MPTDAFDQAVKVLNGRQLPSKQFETCGLKRSLPLQPSASAGTPRLVFSQMYRKAKPEKATPTLDPMLADGWLNALVEDGLVFTADKVRIGLS